MDVPNRPAIICNACVILTVLFVLLCTVINGFVQMSMWGNAPTIMFIVFGLIACVFIFLIVIIIVKLVAVLKGKPIPTSIFGRSHQPHQLAPIDLRAGPPAPNYGPQVMTTYRPTSNTGGQLAPMVLYSGPLPNNQLSGSNPNLPYFGSNTTTLGPPSGPFNQFSRSDSNLARGPNVPKYSVPTSGPYNNQFSGPTGPSPGPYNPNMGRTHGNASSPSAPPPPPRDFDVKPPSYDDAIKK